MEVKIKEIPAKELMGKKIITSISKGETSKLWRPFRQLIREQTGPNPSQFFSIHRYGKEMKEGGFTIDTLFEKCAAIEQSSNRPDGLENIQLEGGVYAVFEHSGSVSKFQNRMQVFYTEWLPISGYCLDDRAHFETFDETYDPFSESSVELIWIPVKRIE